MSTPLRFLIGLAALCALGACGEDEPAAPKSEVPETPTAALAWVRQAEELGDPAELTRRLRQYPNTKPKFERAQETQVVLTWRMQRALEAGEAMTGYVSFTSLWRHFKGEGRTPRGRVLKADILREGFVDAAVRIARTAIEGPTPDRAQAVAAAGTAGMALEDAAGEAEAGITAARRWIDLRELDEPLVSLASHDGPRIVALVDDFALGEAILPSVLGRWQRDLGPMGLRVSVVPFLTGTVRVGIRRLQAQDAKAEVDSIRNRLIARKVKVEQPAADDLHAQLGLEAGRCALFVIDRKGKILARISGPTIDPRKLETVVQRVASR